MGRTKPRFSDTTEDEHEDEHEEVFTLGSMSTPSQTRVNRYYTAEEVEGLDVDINDTDEVNDKPPDYDASDVVAI